MSSSPSYRHTSYHSTESSDSELAALVGPPATAAENNGNYYFLNKKEPSFKNGVSIEEERVPYGATEDEFRSRPVNGGPMSNITSSTKNNTNRGFFSNLLRPKNNGFDPTLKSLMKKRQAAIKIEPKVFFANERTFLAWLHSSVLLAGASVAMTSLSKDNLLSQLYGIILLPVAIAFMCYSMHQYGRRAQMIRRRSPGPYEDIIGPSVLAVALMISIVAQFSIKLYAILE